MTRFKLFRCGLSPHPAYAFGVGIVAGNMIHDADEFGGVYMKGVKIKLGLFFFWVSIVLWGKVVE